MMNYIADKAGVSMEELCLATACGPLKFLAAVKYAELNKFVRNPDNDITSLLSTSYKASIPMVFNRLFALIQLCIELCPNKARFVE